MLSTHKTNTSVTLHHSPHLNFHKVNLSPITIVNLITLLPYTPLDLVTTPIHTKATKGVSTTPIRRDRTIHQTKAKTVILTPNATGIPSSNTATHQRLITDYPLLTMLKGGHLNDHHKAMDNHRYLNVTITELVTLHLHKLMTSHTTELIITNTTTARKQGTVLRDPHYLRVMIPKDHLPGLHIIPNVHTNQMTFRVLLLLCLKHLPSIGLPGIKLANQAPLDSHNTIFNQTTITPNNLV